MPEGRKYRSFKENPNKIEELAPEQQEPERLIGKSVVELISLLPTFCWVIKDHVYEFDHLGITTLATLAYKTFKKDEVEAGNLMSTIPGEPIDLDELDRFLFPPGESTEALISRVVLDEFRRGMKDEWAHIPLIDIDSEMPLDELIPCVKEEMKKTEIDEAAHLGF